MAEENDPTPKAEQANAQKEEAPEQEAAPLASENATENETSELREQLLRLQAEFDNYRKRTDQNIRKSREIGKIELARELLAFVDEFNAAVSHLKGDDAAGFLALQANLVKMLEGQGIRKMECLGKEYDSALHEVLKMEESKEKQGTIVKIIKDGYTCNFEVVRHAFVIVSKGE